MNVLWIAVALGSAALQIAVAQTSDFDLHWKQFKEKHDKKYVSEEEEDQRKAHFVKHVQDVMEHNVKFDMGLVSYQKTVDHPHADKSYEELKNTILGAIPENYEGINRTDFSKMPSVRSAPKMIVKDGYWHQDWNGESKRVTSVKDQGQCGSCWSFSLAGALEGQFYTCNKPTRDLSMQYLVDCTKGKNQYGSAGCSGGSPIWAMDFVKDNRGIPLESRYPYKAKEQSCPSISSNEFYMPITDKIVVGPAGDENAMLNALYNGPLSVGVHVNQDFMNYKSGIFESNNCPPEQRNHAVLVTGHGSWGGNDFWIVKNSWGPNWGDKGYIRMKRNKNNMCGIASTVAYPKVDCSKVK